MTNSAESFASAASASVSAATTPDGGDQRITMFGAQWCGDCRRSKSLLDALEIDYDYVDLEEVADGADRAQAISGKTRIPVIVFPDDTHVVEPNDSLLHAKLTQLGSIRS